MRIIGGSAKGQKIQAPEGMNTRPVTDKIRESLFNIWQFKVDGADFLDLFSGSGSMGLEALSRGADSATFVEMGKEAFEVIDENLKNINVDRKKGILLNLDVLKAIPMLEKQNKSYDLIYIDPPYTNEALYAPVMEALDQSHLLKENGTLAIRAHKSLDLNKEYENLQLDREKKYGISKVYFFSKKDGKE